MIQVKAILPGKFNPLVFRDEFLKAGDTAIKTFEREKKKTEATWKHRPIYNKTIKTDYSKMRFQYWTVDEIVKFVEKGTRPHIIRARRAKRLRFGSGYLSKTLNRKITSYPGAVMGPTRFAQQVHHPGTQEREHFNEIGRQQGPSVIFEFRRAMYNASRKSGHGKK